MNQANTIRILCVGAGHMGAAHARAYAAIDGFEICGVVTRSAESKQKLIDELNADIEGFDDFHAALLATKPDAVSISTYPDTHAQICNGGVGCRCRCVHRKTAG